MTSAGICGAVWLLLLCGCVKTERPTAPPVTPVTASDDELRNRIDRTLDFVYDERRLNLKDHAAWQILHGTLAFQRAFLIDRDADRIPALDHLFSGGKMTGWNLEPVVDEATGHRGLRALVEAGSKTGQGHTDQWLAYMSQSGIDPSQTIQVGDQTFTVADMVAQAQLDVPRNVLREYSWTITAVTSYLPTTTTWVASDGTSWSVEQLMQAEAEQDLATAACGGTHRLYGLALALNRHIAQGGKVEGGWAAADKLIQDSITAARNYQNSDGCFSTNYFQRAGSSPDLAQSLGASGHITEFLVVALPESELRSPWMQRSILNLCDLFERTRKVPLECGALYHAAHALILYRERLYGPRSFGPEAAAGVDPAAAPAAGAE